MNADIGTEENEILGALIEQYARDAKLSPAVRAQLGYIARGAIAREVAAENGVSYQAVRCRRARLFRKLNVSGAPEVLAGLLGMSLSRLARPGDDRSIAA
jgi:DNA-binding CsgD family transcriptional regulator